MQRTWITQRRLLALIVGLLVISSFLPQQAARAIAAPPRHLLELVLTPFRHALKPVNELGLGGGRRVDAQSMEKVLDDRDRLWQENRNLMQRLREAHLLLDQILPIRNRLSEKLGEGLPAEVTAWPRWHLQLNRGTRQGVRRGLVVATSGFDLVGRVSDAGRLTSTTQLITTPETTLAVEIMPPEPAADDRKAVVQLERAEDGPWFIAQIDKGHRVEVDDLAHLADPTWPDEARGFVVGRVTSVEDWRQDPYLFDQITITPNRRLSRLSRVVVILPSKPESP